MMVISMVGRATKRCTKKTSRKSVFASLSCTDKMCKMKQNVEG
jgi:hypothetical protein